MYSMCIAVFLHSWYLAEELGATTRIDLIPELALGEKNMRDRPWSAEPPEKVLQSGCGW